MRMRINISKSKIMKVSNQGEQVKIVTQKRQFESANTFEYLGSYRDEIKTEFCPTLYR